MGNNSRKFIKVTEYNTIYKNNKKGEFLYKYHVKYFRYIPIDNILTIITNKHTRIITIIWEQKDYIMEQTNTDIRLKNKNQAITNLYFFNKMAFEDKLKELDNILLVNDK